MVESLIIIQYRISFFFQLNFVVSKTDSVTAAIFDISYLLLNKLLFPYTFSVATSLKAVVHLSLAN